MLPTERPTKVTAKEKEVKFPAIWTGVVVDCGFVLFLAAFENVLPQTGALKERDASRAAVELSILKLVN
tara:strand:+ start:331 stop:537 length:207 start_codon:yes stop_codon:yes gene_type:complete